MIARAAPSTMRIRAPHAAPKRIRDAVGDERLVGRRQALHLNGRLYCPEFHRIPGPNERTMLEENVYRCPNKLITGKSECGVLLLVVANFTAMDGTEMLYATEVTMDEIQRMRRMPLAQKLEYLELTWNVTR